MSLVETLLVNQLGTFVLVFARIGALVMTAPIFGTAMAPIQTRAFLAVSFSLIVTPLHFGATPANLSDIYVFGHYALNEALVGLLLGLGISILLGGVQVTGQIVSQLGGTALTDMFDVGLGETVPVYSQFFYTLTLVMFVLLDGHRLLAGALLDTYVWLPVGKAAFGHSYVTAVTSLMSESFRLGIQAAAPAMTALLLSTLVLGLIGRTLPQINVLAVGFSVNALLTLGCLFLSLGAIAWAFPQQTASAIDVLRDAIRDAAGVGQSALTHGS